MKRYGKKVLAILLALIMILSQIPVLSTAAEDGDPVILHHPSYTQPYFEVTGSPTGYQWYYNTSVEVHKTAVGEVTGEGQALVTASHGTWDAENGVYKSSVLGEGNHVLVLEFADLEKDEWIYFPGFHGYVEDNSMTTHNRYDKGDGVVIEVSDYENPTVLTLFVDLSEGNTLGEFSVSPVISHYEENPVALTGQDKSSFKMTKPEFMDVYCIATFQDGTTLRSDMLNLSPYCYSEPTWKNPTALFTWDEYITGYQWYRYEEKDFTWNITNNNNYDREFRWEDGFRFDEEHNHFVAYTNDETTYQPNGEMFVRAGDKVTFTISAGFDGTTSFSDFAVGDEYINPTFVDGKYTFTATEDSLLAFCFTDDTQFSFTITVEGLASGFFAIEGETDKTLKSAELGDYRCFATYKIDEETFQREVGCDIRMKILNQPTSEEPTVTVNYPDKATFQWYTPVMQNTTCFLTPDEVYSVEGDFNSDTNEWACFKEAGYMFLELFLMEGATLSISFTSENFAGSVEIDGLYLENNNGVYTYTAECDKRINLYIMDQSDFSFKLEYTGDIEVPTAIEGQNTATLTPTKPGYYYCVVTGTDGSAIETDRIEYYYEVTNQPTEEKPEVSVSFADQVKGYQWYSIIEDTFTGTLTEEQADNFMNYYGEIQADGTWKSVQYDSFKNVVIFMTGEAKVKLDIPENATVTGMYEKLEDGTFVSTEDYGLMLCIHAEEPFTVKPVWTINTTEEVAVEGQTSAIFTGAKTGTYYCEIEYKDGEKIGSQSLSYDPYIDEEPSEDKPTVKVSAPELVKNYQWYVYKFDKKSEPLKPEHVARAYNLFKNNKWVSVESEGGIHFVKMNLMAFEGDKLTLDLPEGIEFDVNVEGGTYQDGVITVYNPAITFSVMANQAFELTAKWDYTDYTKEAVAGQTTDTLTLSAPGYYHCVVTYKDGTELVSDTLDYMQRIESQPTDDAPVVKMLWPELVEKYQWFKVTYPTKEVTNATEASDSVIPGQAGEAVYTDGIWYPTGTEHQVNFVTFDVNDGDLIRVTMTDEIENAEVHCVYVNYGYGDYMNPVGNGVFEYTAFDDAPVTIMVSYENGPVATEGIKVEVETVKFDEAVQGQTSATFTGDAGDYLCVITDKDGKEYTTDIISVSDYYLTKLPAENDFTVQVNDPDKVENYQWFILEDVLATRPAVPIDPADDEVEAFYSEDVVFHNGKWYALGGEVYHFGFEVSVGDEIIITPDADFTGELNLRDRADFAQIQQKDGSYIVTVKEDVGMVVLYMFNDHESFTFTAAVKGTKKVAKAVEGAVSASFAPQETGEYFCVVTMKDGTKLTSTSVKYEKPAEPPVSNDPVPPTGESMMIMVVGSVAILAMAAVLALGWSTKRKF